MHWCLSLTPAVRESLRLYKQIQGLPSGGKMVCAAYALLGGNPTRQTKATNDLLNQTVTVGKAP